MRALRRRTPRLETAAGLAACLALGLLLRAPAAHIPLERDEGEYAYIAQDWLDGHVPYADTFDQKPPGAFAAYAAIFATLGRSPAAIHWGAELWTLGTLVLLFGAGAALYSPLAGLLAAAFGAWLTTAPCFRANAANTELFMLLPLTGAFWAALAAEAGEPLSFAFIAGLLSGGAVLFKQVALVNAVVLLFFVARVQRGRGPRLAAFGAGFAAALLPVAACFAAAGAWAPFFDCVVRYNLSSYVRQVPLLQYPALLAAALGPILKEGWGAIALAACGLTLGAPAAANPRARRIAGAWLAASALGAAAGGYFREHYFLQLVPALALLAARGAERLAARFKLGSGAAVGFALAAIAVGVLAAPRYYLSGTPEEKSRLLYGLNPFPESPELAGFIAARTEPDDQVFILGSEPQILFEARRRSAGRSIFAYPLMAPGDAGLARQQEALAEFDRAAPKIVATEYSSGAFLAGPDSSRLLFQELPRRLSESYRVVGLMVTDFERGENRLVLGEEAVALWEKTLGPRPGVASFIVWQRRPQAR